MATNNFINECKNPANCNRYGRLVLSGGETQLNQSNSIQEFTIDDGCYDDGNIIGTVYCKKLNTQLINALDRTLENNSFLAQVGVKYSDDSEEYIDLGKYTIEKPKDELVDNYTSFVSYDDLANNIDKVYESHIVYEGNSITLADLYSDVCYNLGLTPKTLTFLNSDIPISNNPFKNKESNRFVLQVIGKIACSFVQIDRETNEIDLCWLSNTIDYTFYKSDYSTLNGGKISYGPVNSLVIRSASVESENVSESDSASITEYGEHQIVIADDYILNTPQLRTQALSGIWNRVHNLQYVDSELTCYYGKPFLKVGDKIRIYTDENEYFDTYVLQHEFTYNGTFKSVIKSPVLTEQQVQIKQDISLAEKLYQTALTVDKQNGVISSVISETVDMDNPDSIAYKQSQITQTVDELNSKISDIADITTSGESLEASFDLDNINTSEPITVKVYPVGTNISYLYPRSNLYPSDTLYMTDRKILFHNNTTNEDFSYILPDDLLYYDSTHYDEFLLDYGDGTAATQICQVTKRCKYNADGTVSLLSQEETTDYTYPTIDLTDGDYTISIPGYSQGYIFARLMAKNIYTTQFYTKVETNTMFEQTNNSITSVASQKVGNNEIISKINQTPEQITINANKLNLMGYITATNLATSGQTTINGDNVMTGKIKSSNYVANQSGTSIDLTTGVIDSKNFKVDSNGTMTSLGANFKDGDIVLTDTATNRDVLKIGRQQDPNHSGHYEGYLWIGGFGSSSVSLYDDSMTFIGENDNLINLLGDDGTIQCTGQVISENGVCQGSLAEIKENFEKLQNALDIIKQTDIYKFNYKNEKEKSKKHIGLVIGDKYNYSKELTNKENNAADLYSMVGVCFKAIKEQQEEIEKLKEMMKNGSD